MSELKLIKLASHHAWQPVGRYAPAGGSGIPTGFHSEMSNPVGMPDTPPPWGKPFTCALFRGMYMMTSSINLFNKMQISFWL